MPFKNRQQQKACYAKNDPKWDCSKWSKESSKNLPSRPPSHANPHAHKAAQKPRYY